jgi:hypothetical protein
MTKIRKVELKTVASEEIKAIANQDLEKEDPENAREIIELCSQDNKDSSKEC